MSSYVPAPLRRAVAKRASGICEYCLLSEDDAYFGCEVEHIIAEKHGGKTIASNLAMACAFCNRSKGTDIATIAPATGLLCRLFNPRTDHWSEHFRLEGARIVPKTDIGAATVLILQMNHPDRLDERRLLIETGRFPSPAARARMRTARP